jgi:hypothetical protein
MSPEEAGELARAASAAVEGGPYRLAAKPETTSEVVAEVGTETKPLTDGNQTEEAAAPDAFGDAGDEQEQPRRRRR